MKLPSELTTVTPLSKALALILFILLPVISFFSGMRYQEIKMQGSIAQTVTTKQTPEILLVQYNSDSSNIQYEIEEKKFYKIEKGVKEKIGKIDYILPSPDGTKKLIKVWGLLTSPQIFVQHNNIIKEIGWAEGTSWSHNSKYLVFTSKAADAGNAYNLRVYDTTTNNIKSLTENVNANLIANPTMTSYHNPRWLPDDTGVIVEYKEYNDIPYGNIIHEGTTTVLLK